MRRPLKGPETAIHEIGECTRDGTTMTGDVVVTAADSENVKGTVRMKTTPSDGNHTMNMNSTFTSKWIGEACGDVQ